MTKLLEHTIILHCLHEHWPAEVAMIGDDLTGRIIDDALSGKRTEFQAARGGYDFDFVPYIDTVINATSLLVALLGYYEVYKARQQEKRSRDHTDATEQDVVELLARLLQEEKKVETNKATKLARLFIRIIDNNL